MSKEVAKGNVCLHQAPRQEISHQDSTTDSPALLSNAVSCDGTALRYHLCLPPAVTASLVWCTNIYMSPALGAHQRGNATLHKQFLGWTTGHYQQYLE